MKPLTLLVILMTSTTAEAATIALGVDPAPDMIAVWQVEHGLEATGELDDCTQGVMRAVTGAPTEEDIQWTAAVIHHECSSVATDEECVGVGWTVRNRSMRPDRYGCCPREVARQRSQYARGARKGDHNDDERAIRIAGEVLTAPLESSPIGRATHFYSPRSMPKKNSPEWPGDELAKHRRIYQEDGKYFLHNRGGRRIYLSTSGGWDLVERRGGLVEVARPGFARRMKRVEVAGVRDWYYRFYG